MGNETDNIEKKSKDEEASLFATAQQNSTAAQDKLAFEDMGPLEQIIAAVFMLFSDNAKDSQNSSLIDIASGIFGNDDWLEGMQNWRMELDFSQFDFSGARKIINSPLMNLPYSGDPDFNESFKFVLGIEGGMNPDEPNGAIANFGINSAAHPEIDVKNLTAADAMKIYKEDYWDPMVKHAADNGYNLDQNQMLVVFDAAVNHGNGFAKNMLTETGGNVSAMIDYRRDEYARLAQSPDYAKYKGGWDTRLAKLETHIAETPARDYFAADRGPIVLNNPVDYKVSDTYGIRESHPVYKTRSMHRGTDLATPRGTDLVSQTDAQVAYAGHSDGYGNIVVLHHGQGVYSMYAHLDRMDVKTGQTVQAGEKFADTGNTGVGEGAHLHHEIWIQRGDNAYTVDPQMAWGKDLTNQSTQNRLIADAQAKAGNYTTASRAFDARVSETYRADSLTGAFQTASHHTHSQQEEKAPAVDTPQQDKTSAPAITPG